LAGPVVAACVVLKDFNFSVRIDDSKALTPLARERAYRQITKKAFIGIGIVPEGIIDEVNIYRATIMAMESAVLNLDVKPDILFIDGNIKLRLDYRQLSIIGGDRKSISIACASIVAKVTRDRLLRFYGDIFPGYGFERHKGYGTKHHAAAIRDKGFSPIHRRSFQIGNINENKL
jgi:ribonuclease HII